MKVREKLTKIGEGQKLRWSEREEDKQGEREYKKETIANKREKKKKREKGEENERNMKRKRKQRENWLYERVGVKQRKR